MEQGKVLDSHLYHRKRERKRTDRKKRLHEDTLSSIWRSFALKRSFKNTAQPKHDWISVVFRRELVRGWNLDPWRWGQSTCRHRHQEDPATGQRERADGGWRGLTRTDGGWRGRLLPVYSCLIPHILSQQQLASLHGYRQPAGTKTHEPTNAARCAFFIIAASLNLNLTAFSFNSLLV